MPRTMETRQWLVGSCAVLIVAVLIVGAALAAAPVLAGQVADDPPGSGSPGEDSSQQSAVCDLGGVYDEAVPSVVTVRAFDQAGDRSLGSGWVYATDGSDALVVTNFHVVAGASGADVRFSDGQWRNVGAVEGVDPHADLAVVRVSDVPDGVEPLPVAGSLPDHGDEVAAIGSPLGLRGTVTRGVVSAVDRSVTVPSGSGVVTIADAIQVDTPISPGSSGGPLVNCDGEVVGVNFAGVDPLVGQDINFAISASMVRQVVPALLENGSYEHAYLGVRTVTLSPTVSRVNGIDGTTQGVLVDSVVAGGPADGVLHGSPDTERATGLPVGGDVIVAADGTPVGDTHDLRDYLFEETQPGDTVELTVIRDGERQQVAVTIAVRSPSPERPGTGEASV